MSDITQIMIQQVITMLICMIVGFTLFKSKVVSDSTLGQLTELVLMCCAPCLGLNAWLGLEKTPELLNKMGVACALAVGHFALAQTVFYLIYKNKKRLIQYSAIIGNFGFLAIPLIRNVMGEECVVYCNILSTVATIWQYSLGTKLISEKAEIKLDPLTIILTPGILSIIIGFTIFMLQIELPAPLANSIATFGNANSAVVYICLGGFLSQCDIKAVFKKKDTFIMIFNRLILVPVCFILICTLLPAYLNPVKITLGIAISTPCGTTFPMFANKYGNDYKFCSGIVGITTLLSILTMPIMVSFSQAMFK